MNVKDGIYESQVVLDAMRVAGDNTKITTSPVTRLRDITTLPSGEIVVLSDGKDGELLHLNKRQ